MDFSNEASYLSQREVSRLGVMISMHVAVGVEHLHLLIETAKVETTTLEGNDQLEEGKPPIDRIGAEKSPGGVLTDQKGGGDVGRRPRGGMLMDPSALLGGDSPDRTGKKQYQIDAMAPGGVVGKRHDTHRHTEITVFDDLPATHRLVEEPVVEHHRHLGACRVGLLEEGLAVPEVLFHDIGLAVPGHQRLFQEQPPGPERQEAARVTSRRSCSPVSTNTASGSRPNNSSREPATGTPNRSPRASARSLVLE